jgi:hypothetical protein
LVSTNAAVIEFWNGKIAKDGGDKMLEKFLKRRMIDRLKKGDEVYIRARVIEVRPNEGTGYWPAVDVIITSVSSVKDACGLDRILCFSDPMDYFDEERKIIVPSDTAINDILDKIIELARAYKRK